MFSSICWYIILIQSITAVEFGQHTFWTKQLLIALPICGHISSYSHYLRNLEWINLMGDFSVCSLFSTVVLSVVNTVTIVSKRLNMFWTVWAHTQYNTSFRQNWHQISQLVPMQNRCMKFQMNERCAAKMTTAERQTKEVEVASRRTATCVLFMRLGLATIKLQSHSDLLLIFTQSRL